jgi:DNA-directed RNA polymerase specialized sigma24 family protein
MASYEYSVLAELAAPAPAGLSDSAPLTFAHIFRTHAAYVLGLVHRLGVSARDAEDVAQEVFLAVHAALPHFERRSKSKTWLCAMHYHQLCGRGLCRRRRDDLCVNRQLNAKRGALARLRAKTPRSRLQTIRSLLGEVG